MCVGCYMCTTCANNNFFSFNNYLYIYFLKNKCLFVIVHVHVMCTFMHMYVQSCHLSLSHFCPIPKPHHNTFSPCSKSVQTRPTTTSWAVFSWVFLWVAVRTQLLDCPTWRIDSLDPFDCFDVLNYSSLITSMDLFSNDCWAHHRWPHF